MKTILVVGCNTENRKKNQNYYRNKTVNCHHAVYNVIQCFSSFIMRRNTKYRVLLWFSVSALVLSFLPFAILPDVAPQPPAIQPHPNEEATTTKTEASCALCFFGLPRS